MSDHERERLQEWIAERAAERARFERWISAPPFEADVARWPMAPERSAWPGQYVDLKVQLAWRAWLAAQDADEEPQL